MKRIYTLIALLAFVIGATLTGCSPSADNASHSGDTNAAVVSTNK